MQSAAYVNSTGALSYYNPQSGVLQGFDFLTQTSRPHAFRHLYRGITCHLTASAINDGGTVYATQLTGRHRVSPVGRVDVGGTTIVQEAHFHIPLEETSLAQLSPEPYIGNAKEGVYLPLRLQGPVQPFALGAIPVIANSDIVTAPPLTLAFDYGGPTVGQVPVMDNAPITALPSQASWINDFLGGRFPTNAFTLGDLAYDNLSVGVIIFRGLAGPAGAGFGASVTVKTMIGMEVVPRIESPERSFVRAPAECDSRALAAYYALAYELPDAFPASYNFFGTLLPMLGNLASKIWPVVRQVLPTIGSAVMSSIDSAVGPSASAAGAPPVGGAAAAMATSRVKKSRVAKAVPKSRGKSRRKARARGK